MTFGVPNLESQNASRSETAASGMYSGAEHSVLLSDMDQPSSQILVYWWRLRGYSVDDDLPKRIPIKDLRQEEGASELASSPDMEPYLEYIIASMQGADIQPHLDALSNLPLEKRYVWRVASAMKWAFADFDSEPVAADRDTLKPEDFAKVMELLKFRPIQFCMFLKELLGAEEMKNMMLKAISVAGRMG